MKLLNLGCGHNKTPPLLREHKNVVHLDMNPDVNPDVVWDLNNHPLPFKDKEFNEIHAYDVLEHLGRQGDYKFFFREWNEYYRILKEHGYFICSVPWGDSYWIWGDPGHTRHISPGTFIFLNQDDYKLNEELKTQMTDYRNIYKGDFAKVWERFDYNNSKYIVKLERK